MIDSKLAKSIRLVGLDVDGVLTDSGIYLGSAGGRPIEFKRYDIQDGFGISQLRRAGLVVVIVTGRVSESVRMRAAELDIPDVAQDDDARKLPAFLEILRRYGITPGESAFIGDDFPDLAILRMVGLPVAVANAAPEIARASVVQLARNGGFGAVREFAELLLKARDEWTALYEQYVAEKSQPRVTQ